MQRKGLNVSLSSTRVFHECCKWDPIYLTTSHGQSYGLLISRVGTVPLCITFPFELIVFTIFCSRFVKHPFSLLVDVLGSKKLSKRHKAVQMLKVELVETVVSQRANLKVNSFTIDLLILIFLFAPYFSHFSLPLLYKLPLHFRFNTNQEKVFRDDKHVFYLPFKQCCWVKIPVSQVPTSATHFSFLFCTK